MSILNKIGFDNNILRMALFSTLTAVLISLSATSFNSIASKLAIIISTILLQLSVMSKIKKKYSTQDLNLYFIHPVFYINLAVIFYFFLSLVFYLFNSEIFYQSIDFESISYPLLIFCFSIVILNFMFILFDKRKIDISKKTYKLENITNSFQQALPVVVIFYALSWITRILIMHAGIYSLLLTSPEVIGSVRGKYPFLLPLFMFFNSDIPFQIIFIFWILYYSVLNSNKKYKLMIQIFLVADLLYFLPTGGKQGVLTPILAVMFASLILGKRIPKKIIVFILLFLLSLPIYNSYRHQGGSLKDSQTSIIEFQKTAYGEQRGYLFTTIESICRRADAFSGYFYFTQIIQDNFLMGETYSMILLRLFPGFLVPSSLPEYMKAKSFTEMAQAFGIVRTSGYFPGVLAIWGELYLNFGYAGILIGVPLVGIFCMLMFNNLLRSWKFSIFVIYLYLPFEFLLLIHAGMDVLISPLIKIALIMSVAKLFVIHRTRRLSSKEKPTY